MSACRYCGDPSGDVEFCSTACFDAHRDFMADLQAEADEAPIEEQLDPSDYDPHLDDIPW